MILAGDIGGTKVDLALYDPALGPRRPVVECTIRSADYADLATPIRAFLSAQGVCAERCVLGSAGPVVDGRAIGVNVPWEVDQAQLSETLEMPVALLNDLQAVAHAVPYLAGDDLVALHRGRPDVHGAKAVIAPGTGLGEAYLTWDGARYRPHPSEGGHADFAPADAMQARLLLFLMAQGGHVSYERVCSGIGMPNLYAFLRDAEQLETPDWLLQELATTGDPTPIIVKAGLDAERPCPICQQAVVMFVRILGAEAGNLGLRYLATGGVYIAGGLPAHVMPLITSGPLLAAFLEKGRLRFMVEEIPLYVVTRLKVGLYGAACAALGTE